MKWKHPVPLLLGDNQVVIGFTTKSDKHFKFKHIAKQGYLVCRNVELKKLTPRYVGTKAMVADVVTKALRAVKLTSFRCVLKVLPIMSKGIEVTTSQTTDEARASTNRGCKSQLDDDNYNMQRSVVLCAVWTYTFSCWAEQQHIKIKTISRAKIERLQHIRFDPLFDRTRSVASNLVMLHRYVELLEHLDPMDEDIVDVLPPACSKQTATCSLL